MQGRIASRIFSTRGVLRLDQRSLATRAPSLTLFSGPRCSLCDDAKEALSIVKKDHPFDLEVVNIRDPGQELWMKKYVYWIPVLHIDGEEVARGRWGEAEARRALQKWEQEQNSNTCGS